MNNFLLVSCYLNKISLCLFYLHLLHVLLFMLHCFPFYLYLHGIHFLDMPFILCLCYLGCCYFPSFFLYITPKKVSVKRRLLQQSFVAHYLKIVDFRNYIKLKAMTDIVPIYLIHILYLMSELLLKNTSRSVSIFIPIHF